MLAPVALCVAALMAACAHVPADIRPYVSDLGAMNVSHGRLGPFRYVRSASYLPGTMRQADPARHAASRYACADGLLLILRGAQGVALDDVRDDVCKAHREITGYFPGAAGLRFLSLRMIPEGQGYRRQWLSVGSDPGMSLALRYFDDVGFGRRQIVRLASHELFHVYAGFGHAPVSGTPSEEAAATLFESCIELDVFGATRGDVVDPVARARTIGRARDSAAARSLVGAAAALEIATRSGVEFPIVKRTSASARRLAALCGQLVSGTAGAG